MALAAGGTAEGVGLGAHERLRYLLDQQAQHVDVAFLEELA